MMMRRRIAAGATTTATTAVIIATAALMTRVVMTIHARGALMRVATLLRRLLPLLRLLQQLLQ